MDIVFKNKKIDKLCNNQKLLVKEFGADRAKRIRRRLDDLRAVAVLEDMRNFLGRCHELLYARSDQLSLDLDHPYRLIFEPSYDLLPKKPDGGLDWTKISSVTIVGVEDTHD
jgi:plasmid maintenance system killer protein